MAFKKKMCNSIDNNRNNNQSKNVTCKQNNSGNELGVHSEQDDLQLN